jgi:hypothetical protein
LRIHPAVPYSRCTKIVPKDAIVVTEPNRQQIREHIIESLCEVRGDDRALVDQEIERHQGDLRIDSKEGEAVCAIVEDALELGELVQAADLLPEQLTSIQSLTELFEKRVADHVTEQGKDAA